MGALVPRSLKELPPHEELVQAVRRGDVEETKRLVGLGADGFNEWDDTRTWTPWLHACSSGNLDIVHLFMKEGADIHQTDKQGWSALVWAAHNGHDQIVSMLCLKGADPNFRDKETGRTPLMGAALNGHYVVVKVLLENGANPAVKDKEGATALTLATTISIQEIIFRADPGNAKKKLASKR